MKIGIKYFEMHAQHATCVKFSLEKNAEITGYSSCRYNERQLIDVTVVRRVRPRAERRYHAYHHVRTYRFLPADTYLVHNTYLVSYCRSAKTKIWRTHAHIFSSLLIKPRIVEDAHRFLFLDVPGSN